MQEFQNALKSITDVAPDYKNFSDLEIDGLIQRFEFTFELAWKTIQDFIESIGYVNIKGPRNVIKQMVNDGFIEEKIWQDMIEARNELSHLYDEKLSREYAEKIVNHFITGFKDLENFLLKNVGWKK